MSTYHTDVNPVGSHHNRWYITFQSESRLGSWISARCPLSVRPKLGRQPTSPIHLQSFRDWQSVGKSSFPRLVLGGSTFSYIYNVDKPNIRNVAQKRKYKQSSKTISRLHEENSKEARREIEVWCVWAE